MSPTRALVRRLAVAALVVSSSTTARAQLGPPPQPLENPITDEKTMLGKILFWDEQLSSDNTMACGTCHQPHQGGADPRFTQTPGPDGKYYTDDDIYASPGVISSDSTGHYVPSPAFGLGPQVTPRLAQNYIMGSYFTLNFWDGRASSTFTDPQTGQQLIASGGALESQCVNPPFGPIEMADPGRTWNDLINKITAATPLALATDLPTPMRAKITEYPSYPDLFKWVYGDSAITSARIAFAIATYERSLVPDQTAWDRFMEGDKGAIDDLRQKGMALFMGTARCNLCHVPPLFSDDLFHTLGVRPPREDMGLELTTGVWSDRGKFKTPSLRDTAERRRWMHNGRFGDVNHVLEFYIRGGDFADNQDPLIIPLSITPMEKFQIYEFVTDSLTDPRVAAQTDPFDRPTLHSEAAANPSYYGDSSAGSGGFIPQMINVTPPILGSPSFRIGVGDALGGSVAILALAAHDAPPGTTFNGVPLDLSINPLPFLLSVTLSGTGAGGGYGTVVMQLPRSPVLAGQDWYAQWFVVDSYATGGIAASSGTHFQLFDG